MRQFYVEYSNEANLKLMVSEIGENQSTSVKILKPMVSVLPIAKLPQLVANVSWTKNIVIIQKCKDPLERVFYIKVTRRFGWTKDVLINNIENKAYERYLMNQINFDETVAEKYQLQAKLAVKDEYKNATPPRVCQTQQANYSIEKDQSQRTEIVIGLFL